MARLTPHRKSPSLAESRGQKGEVPECNERNEGGVNGWEGYPLSFAIIYNITHECTYTL